MVVRLVGGGAISLQFAFIVTGRNGLPVSPKPNFNWVEGVNLDCLLCHTFNPMKRKGKLTYPLTHLCTIVLSYKEVTAVYPLYSTFSTSFR